MLAMKPSYPLARVREHVPNSSILGMLTKTNKLYLAFSDSFPHPQSKNNG